MKGGSQIYWLLWFVVGFGVPEYFGIKHPEFSTLTATVKWLCDSLPLVLSLVLSGAISAALLWLASVHWIWRIWDRPGFDSVEAGITLIGFLLGVSAALATRKSPPTLPDRSSAAPPTEE